MPEGITGEVRGDKELIAKLGQVVPKARVYVRDQLQRVQIELQNNIRSLFLSGSPLHVRSGDLRNSINAGPIQESEQEIRGPVGTNLIYAAPQNYGATISAKNVQFLTIPLDAALTPAGVMRWSAREIISNPGEGGYLRTFFRNGILFGSDGNTIDPLFALKTSVTIPPRPFMQPGLESVRGDFLAGMASALDRAKQELGL